MTTLARLVVKLTADAGSFEQQMTQTQRSVLRAGQQMERTGRRMTAGITLPLLALGGVALDAASDLEEATSKAQVVFGDASDAVLEFADNSAESLGISEDVALDAVATFGNLFDALEMTESASVEMSTGMVQLASDLASFNNIDPTQTLTALRSGIVGEVEPLRRLGINLNQATVEARALEMGLAATSDELTQANMVTARYSLIMEQSANAQDDFARTAEGMANSTRIGRAELRNAAATLGQNLLPVALDVVHGINDLVAGFNDLSPAAQQAIVTLGGIAAVSGPALSGIGSLVQGVTRLVPLVSQMPAALSAAARGYQLYQKGATLAQLSSVSLSAALVPLAAAFAAVAAVAVAAYSAYRLHAQIQEQTAEVSNQWTQFLDRQADEQESAVGVAEAYAEAQRGVNQAYEEGGIVAEVFIDRQVVMTASTEDLHNALVQTAGSYADYVAAAEQVNAAGTNNIQVMSDVQFELERLADAGAVNAEAYEWASRAVETHTDAVEEGAGAIEDAGGAIDALTAALQATGAETSRVAGLEMQLSQQLGQTTQLASAQDSALTLLAMAFDEGVISQQDYIDAGLDVLAVQDDNIDGYLAVRTAVEGATQGYFGLTQATGGAGQAIQNVAQAAQDAAAQAEEMAARQEAAWQSFGGSVETGVAGALEAYRAGNSEMLAEQQSALAEMLWNQTDTMLGLGQITQDQAMAMKSAIAGEFGVIVDEVEVAQGELLALFGDWSTQGETSAEDIVGFIQNIGTATDELVTAQEEDILAGIEAWQNASSEIGLSSEELEGYYEAVEGASETMTDTAITGLDDTVAAAGDAAVAFSTNSEDMIGSFGDLEYALAEDAQLIVSHLNDIATAAGSIPSNVTIGVNVNASVPEEFELNSPQFRFQTALEDLVRYAGANPVPVSVAGGGGAASVPAAAGLAGGMGISGGGTTTWTGNIVIDGSGNPQETARVVVRALEDRGILPRGALR